MKVAIATDNYETVTGHVGRCKGFLVIEVEKGEIIKKEERENNFTNHGRGHQHGHPHHGGEHKTGHQRLAEGINDCCYLISHGMGWRLVDDLKENGIEPIITSETNAESAAVKLEAGTLEILDDAECHSH